MATKPNEKGEDKSLVVFTEVDAAIARTELILIETTIQSEDELKKLENTYLNMSVQGTLDMAGYTAVTNGLKDVKKIKKTLDDQRTALNAPALKWQRSINEKAKGYDERLAKIVDHLMEVKAKIDDKKAAEARAELLKRSNQLTENGYELVAGFYVCGALRVESESLGAMDEVNFNFYLTEGEKELKRQQAEKDRLQKEKDDLAAERAEIAKLREEMAANLEQMRLAAEELKAQGVALNFAYESIEINAESVIVDSFKKEQEPSAASAEVVPEPAQAKAEQPSPATGGGVNFGGGQSSPAAAAASNPNEKKVYGPGAQMGFDNFRMQLVAFLTNPRPEGEKLKMSQIVEFAKTVELKLNM